AQKRRIMTNILNVLTKFSDEWSVAQTIETLAPTLDDNMRARALDRARQIRDKRYRTSVLQTLATHAPPEQQRAILDEAVAITDEVPDKWSQANILASLAADYPTEQQPELVYRALRIVEGIGDNAEQIALLTFLGQHAPTSHTEQTIFSHILNLIPHLPEAPQQAKILKDILTLLPPELYDHALTCIRQLPYKSDKVQLLCTLAPFKPPRQQKKLITEALIMAQTIDDEWSRGSALSLVAAQLADDEREEVLADIIDRARNINDSWYQAGMLNEVIPFLPAEQQEEILNEALEVAYTIDDAWYRANILSEIAAKLSGSQKEELLNNTLQRAYAIEDEWYRANLLGDMAPHLPANLHDQALQLLDNLVSERAQTQAISALAPYLPRHHWPPLLDKVHNIEDEWYQATAWRQLAPLLTGVDLHSALNTITKFDDTEAQLMALPTLCAQLPLEIGQAQAARFDDNPYYQLLIQLALLPRLSTTERLAIYQKLLTTAPTLNDEEAQKDLIQQAANQVTAVPEALTMLQLGRHLPRPLYLHMLLNLLPLLLPPDDPEGHQQLYQAIITVGQQWP
ncbi:MAG TPA: hypothetical protein VLL52_22355, partial [Anaerolineae bacterium]|nr:hypothetical protein [Anaerolineae bacterium]